MADNVKLCKRGKLIMIDGPMFSFKSSELIQRVRYELAAKRSAIIFKPSSDTRGDKGSVETHDNIKEKAVMIEDEIGKYKEQALAYDVIGIDEGQFFKGLADFCRDLSELHGKVVIVAGLNLNFKGEPWPEMQALYPYATEIVRRHAACHVCGKPAIFTIRLGGGTALIQPGGKETYRPVCAMHRKDRETKFLMEIKSWHMPYPEDPMLMIGIEPWLQPKIATPEKTAEEKCDEAKKDLDNVITMAESKLASNDLPPYDCKHDCIWEICPNSPSCPARAPKCYIDRHGFCKRCSLNLALSDGDPMIGVYKTCSGCTAEHIIYSYTRDQKTPLCEKCFLARYPH